MTQRYQSGFTVWALVALLSLAGALSAAPAALQDATVKGLELSLHGDSTLHKWQAKAARLTLTAALKSGSGPLLGFLRGGGLAGLTLTVEVASLHSPEGKSMDKNMHKAMHAKEFPEIRFVMGSYEIDDKTVKAKGNLEINGVVKEALLVGSVAAMDDGVQVEGSFDMKMSEFKIPPPVMMLGTIRTADAVKVQYGFQLSRAEKP